MVFFEKKLLKLALRLRKIIGSKTSKCLKNSRNANRAKLKLVKKYSCI